MINDSLYFKTLYVEHNNWLKRWLQGRLGCHESAADFAQDTFIRLMTTTRKVQFDSGNEARAYLKKTAKNLCINRWRQQEIERAWIETLQCTSEELHPSPEHQVAVLAALEQLSQLLERLPEKTARAFMLAIVCDLTDQQVANEMGISDRMVRKHVAKAMLACARLSIQNTVHTLLE
ncbi:RNA polymerase sigma-70 factor, ECF subfamily [Nitrincola lacisaponensis]|uniref:RNA polymerase sigma-70 factor, ECF subfamily n=1 Tax=Nitrincola lacisaponensis TaxID=267850 RepID=A0A063Y261_9GAMM|nr:sigma-70 family RNA polymerase sigma factor [Nitrincola lacisaponensis]KDE39769.1 RNA polymerase sigma-70 factor, ECF subfamily [Nitrincola lacisaponensis]